MLDLNSNIFLLTIIYPQKLNDVDFTLNFKDTERGYNITMDVSATNMGMNTFDEVFYNKIEKEEYIDYNNNFESGISIKIRCNRLTKEPKYIVIEYNKLH